MKFILKIIWQIIKLILFLFIWFVYAYLTLDRSSGEPMPGGYSFIVLPFLMSILLKKYIFNKKLSKWYLFWKIVVFLLFILGILVHF
jgi:hypothetical protein